MKIRNRWIFFLLIFLLLLSGCGLGGPPKIEVNGAAVLEAKAAPPAASGGCHVCDAPLGNFTSRASLTIRNRGGEADRLLKVETEGAVLVSFRKTSDAQDLSNSVPVDAVEIPPHGRVEFGGSRYAMLLTGLREDLTAGQTLRLTLYFEKSGPVTVDAAIIARK